MASPTAALMPTGSPIAAAMKSTKSRSASAFPKALCAAGADAVPKYLKLGVKTNLAGPIDVVEEWFRSI